MEPRRPRIVARVVVTALVVAAVASLAGCLVLLLDRAGVIELRHVPQARIWATWDERNHGTVAIVNTDVVGGSFVLRCVSVRVGSASLGESNGPETTAGEERIEIPARSILLRRWPVPVHMNQPFLFPELYGGRGPCLISRNHWAPYSLTPRLVRRGSRVTLEWSCGSVKRLTDFVMAKRPGVSLVPSRALVVTNDQATRRATGTPGEVKYSRGEQPPEPAVEFTYDGSAPLEIDIDRTTPGPGFFDVWATHGGGVIWSHDLLVYDADMTVIDERTK